MRAAAHSQAPRAPSVGRISATPRLAAASGFPSLSAGRGSQACTRARATAAAPRPVVAAQSGRPTNPQYTTGLSLPGLLRPPISPNLVPEYGLSGSGLWLPSRETRGGGMDCEAHASLHATSSNGQVLQLSPCPGQIHIHGFGQAMAVSKFKVSGPSMPHLQFLQENLTVYRGLWPTGAAGRSLLDRLLAATATGPSNRGGDGVRSMTVAQYSHRMIQRLPTGQDSNAELASSHTSYLLLRTTGGTQYALTLRAFDVYVMTQALGHGHGGPRFQHAVESDKAVASAILDFY